MGLQDCRSQPRPQQHALICTVWFMTLQGIPGSSAGEESTCNTETQIQFLGQEDPLERDRLPTPVFLGFPGGSVSRESVCNVGDLSLIPELGRSPERGHGNSLQYSCLENPHGQRSLVGCSTWGRKQSDMTE